MLRGALLLLLLGGPAQTARAQDARTEGAQAPREAPRLFLDRPATGPPVVRAQHLLGDGVFEAALRNGFPIRYHFRLELWRDGALFDNLVSDAAWDAVVHLDPVSGTYTLLRSGVTEERFGNAESLERALAVPFTVDIVPPEMPAGRRYYYVATLEMESLSLTELEEVERWLKGDLGPAIRRSGEVGNALGRGARRLLIRLSGMPRRKLEVRSEAFRTAAG